MVVLTRCGEVEGAGGGTSSSAPCDGYEEGIESGHTVESSLKVCKALESVQANIRTCHVGFRWEKFEREERLFWA